MRVRKGSIMLQCSDIQAARNFYTTHLDLEVNADLGWFVGLQQASPKREDPEKTGQTEALFQMSLCEAGHSFVPEAVRGPTAGLVLALEVERAAPWMERWRGAGVTLLSDLIDEPWGQRHFFAAAPDGVALDVFEWIPPDAAWMKAHGFG